MYYNKCIVIQITTKCFVILSHREIMTEITTCAVIFSDTCRMYATTRIVISVIISVRLQGKICLAIFCIKYFLLVEIHCSIMKRVLIPSAFRSRTCLGEFFPFFAARSSSYGESTRRTRPLERGRVKFRARGDTGGV